MITGKANTLFSIREFVHFQQADDVLGQLSRREADVPVKVHPVVFTDLQIRESGKMAKFLVSWMNPHSHAHFFNWVIFDKQRRKVVPAEKPQQGVCASFLLGLPT